MGGDSLANGRDYEIHDEGAPWERVTQPFLGGLAVASAGLYAIAAARPPGLDPPPQTAALLIGLGRDRLAASTDRSRKPRQSWQEGSQRVRTRRTAAGLTRRSAMPGGSTTPDLAVKLICPTTV